jgi:hypothetical protein
VAAGEPADPAAERVARDAHVRRATREGGEAVLGGRDGDVLPHGAGFHTSGAGGGVDLDASHAGGLEEQHSVERFERRGAVAGALWSDAQSARARESHGLDDILCGAGDRDGGGPLIDREVPRPPRFVVARIARREEFLGA